MLLIFTNSNIIFQRDNLWYERNSMLDFGILFLTHGCEKMKIFYHIYLRAFIFALFQCQIFTVRGILAKKLTTNWSYVLLNKFNLRDVLFYVL